MAFAVATMKKLKVENLKGLERHNQRETQNHENVDIDTSRSHLNYDLVNDNSVNYQKDVMGYIEQNRKSTRAVRRTQSSPMNGLLVLTKSILKRCLRRIPAVSLRNPKTTLVKNLVRITFAMLWCTWTKLLPTCIWALCL